MLFATQKLSVDLVALMVISALRLSGVITAREGLAGFSNMRQSPLQRCSSSPQGCSKPARSTTLVTFWRGWQTNFWLMSTVMIAVGIISAFINNTAAVAVAMDTCNYLDSALLVFLKRVIRRKV